MTKIIKYVSDVKGRKYPLVELLGRGGQGEVFAVEGGKLAVKLLFRRSHSEDQYQNLLQTINSVRRLPLDGLSIAKPLELLQWPDIGYVMEFMTDMVPISHLIVPRLKLFDGTQLIDWYVETGGLRRRLRVLANTASVLSRLHGMGLVYGDISHRNIFVSRQSDMSEVWLIDADNLRYRSNAGELRLYTRGYGAPEILKGMSGVNTLTDTYSFAVLAFQTLTLTHPLYGDMVHDGEPELEDKALRGELPWIEHPDDDSNRSSTGILPREKVVSPRLHGLFKQTFVEGLNDSLQRPPLTQWAEYLHAAADLTLRCPNCDGTYFHNVEECPWCGAPRPSFAILRIKLWHPNENLNTELRQKSLAGLSTTIPGTLDLSHRITTGYHIETNDIPAIRIKFTRGKNGVGVVVSNLDGGQYWFESYDGSSKFEIDVMQKHLTKNGTIHLGPVDKMHRTIEFRVREG